MNTIYDSKSELKSRGFSPSVKKTDVIRLVTANPRKNNGANDIYEPTAEVGYERHLPPPHEDCISALHTCSKTSGLETEPASPDPQPQHPTPGPRPHQALLG